MGSKFALATFEDVIRKLTCVCVCTCLQVILTEVYSIGFRRSFFDEEDLTCIAENDVIYAFQAPPLYIRGGSARISGSCLTEAGN